MYVLIFFRNVYPYQIWSTFVNSQTMILFDKSFSDIKSFAYVTLQMPLVHLS